MPGSRELQQVRRPATELQYPVYLLPNEGSSHIARRFLHQCARIVIAEGLEVDSRENVEERRFLDILCVAQFLQGR